MLESLDRPTSLPKLRQKSTRLSQPGNAFIKSRRKTSRITHREIVVPHLEKGACERLIYEKVDTALSGTYEQRAEFLNQLHQLILETLPESLNTPEFFELICLKIVLFLKDEYPAIRAMCFRILRLCLFTERNLTFMLNNHADIYVVRSLDLCVDNEIERCEALRLIGAMINVYETSFLKKLIEDSIAQNNGKKYAFPKSIMQPVIAIALKAINKPSVADNGEQADKDDDRLSLSCIAMFLEFCIHEPRLIINMSGTDWIVKILTGNSGVNKGITNLVCRVLVNWLDDPAVRNMAQLHLVLEQIFAPLIEFGFFEKNVAVSERVDKMVESVMVTFSHSFLGILRSWSGLFACAAVGPNSNVIASSPLRLLEYLGLGTVGNANLSHIRDMIVNICCDFMEAPYAQKSFESWKEAVDFYGSLTTPDVFSNSLKEDFVLAQSDIIIGNNPEFVKYVDVLYSFRYLAFFVLINAGLPQSLARLIVANPNAPSAIKATLLLSDFLRVAPAVVPSTWRASVLSMPSLFQSAAEAVVAGKAASAVNGIHGIDIQETFSYINTENAALALHRFDNLNRVWIHNMSVEPPYDSNYSLFMEHRPLTPLLAEKKPWRTDEAFHSFVKSCWKGSELHIRNCIVMFTEALRDVNICHRTDCLNDVIATIAKILSDVAPSKGLQVGWLEDRNAVIAAKRAIHLAMRLPTKTTELEEILVKFVRDMKGKIGTDMFNVKNLIYSGTMYHFAIIGTLSSHKIGSSILEREGFFQMVNEKMNNSTATEFVKVVVAGLDYSANGGGEFLPRMVLQKALTSANEAARRWCTRFLGVIASLRLSDFSDWGIRLLLGQLGDESVKVVRQTIRLLHQWLPIYPESVRNLRPVPLDAFGEAGTLLKAYLYIDENFCISNHDLVVEAVHTWMTGFNTRYFESLDEDMRVSLLDVKRSLTGGFARPSNERNRFGVRAPAHLFGSLARHDYGRTVLEDERVVRQLLIQMGEDKDMALVKGAVVALGQIGGSPEGAKLFSPDVVPKIIRLAEEAPILSVRGAAFWALNMMGTSVSGAELLCEYGWESNQHRWVVDKARRQHDTQETEEENRRPTVTTTIVPEVSISFSNDKSLSARRVDSPLGRYSRTRSSSDGCWSPKAIVQEVPKLRRSGSDFGMQYATADNLSLSEYDSDNVRSRAMTSESGIMTGLSSSFMDDSIGVRRRTTTTNSQCEEMEYRSRSSTIARCLNQGLTVDKSRLEVEGTVADLLRDPHFSTKNREKWRLAPFRTRRFLQVNRNIGDPVRYIFMTKREEECFSIYRNYLLRDSWLLSHLHAVGSTSQGQVAQAVYAVSLPSEVQVMCGNIFHPKKLFAEEMVNDRGAKSGHSKKVTDAGLNHSSYRCFYCESNVEKYPLPSHVDVASLRKQVLYEVDMLEVKESAPEKKLISLRTAHPWLFEWPCLYADVLELLDEYRFKPRSRSFLQEIFYDALKL